MSGDDQRGVRVFGPDGFEDPDVWQKYQEKATATQQADVDDDYARVDEWYEPPYNPEQLVTLLERSETHAACVHAKAQGVAGYGFSLEPHESTETDDDPPGRDTLEDFWFNGTFQLGPDRQPATASDVLENGWNDYESIGWGALEILANPNTGDPTGLAHVPAHTIRRRTDAPGYVQIDGGGQPVQYFGAAGDRYGDSQTFVNGDTGEAGSTVGEVGGTDAVANELLVVRNYSALSPHYGTPDIIPALPTVAGDIAARKFNLNFFDNDGVPRFAVIVEGGELSEKSWTQLEETFKNLKKEQNSHRGVLIEASDVVDAGEFGQDPNVSIRIEPLTVGIEEDASFIDYRQENEHDILKTHGVPPVIANRTEHINYSNAQQQRKEFAQTTIKPRQEKFAARLYQTIHAQAFDVDGWTIAFNLHGGENREREAQIAKTRIEASQGVITVNEAREELGFDPLTDEEGTPLPQGQMLLASVGQPQTPAAQAVDDAVAEAEDQARADERATQLGYSITARADSRDVDTEADD